MVINNPLFGKEGASPVLGWHRLNFSDTTGVMSVVLTSLVATNPGEAAPYGSVDHFLSIVVLVVPVPALLTDQHFAPFHFGALDTYPGG